MNEFDHERLSRVLVHALRHAPRSYGLQLDAEGWAPMSDLLSGVKRADDRWRMLTEEHIQLTAAATRRCRLEIRDDKIRALYGHSHGIGRECLELQEPPSTLFHGTELGAAVKILEEGLCRMQRQFVHLTSDREYALSLKRRKRSVPVLLRVSAADACRQRAVGFHQASEHVWLTEYVPREFIALENCDVLLAQHERARDIQDALISLDC